MSAANATVPSSSLQEEMRAHEPSMEEILASIRRIIADDDSFSGGRREKDDRRRREPETAEAAEPPAAMVAHREPAQEEPAPAVAEARPQPAPVADIRQIRLSRAAPEPVEEEPIDEEPPLAEDDEAEFSEALLAVPDESYDACVPVEEPAPLVSSDAASSVAAHFQALAASMIINESGLLQKYAQEMLRPLLKQWLDDNLPVIVERLVRAEIERVARGGRR